MKKNEDDEEEELWSGEFLTDHVIKEVAGYARVVGNFTQVVVRAAGHIVPGDQPERALDMISRFVEGRGYENLPNPR